MMVVARQGKTIQWLLPGCTNFQTTASSVVNLTTRFLYTQNRALGKLGLKKHLKKSVFIQDLKSNAIFAAAEMFCPLKLSDVPHFTDAGGRVP